MSTRMRGRKPADFDAEIQSHLELETERLIREEGMAPEKAQAAARRAFGNVTVAKEQYYESGRSVWLDQLVQDLRYAARLLGKSPGFTAVAVLTLALGIGANTAIFSVAYGVLFRSLPYSDPDRLVVLWNRFPGLGIEEDWPSPAQYAAIRDTNGVFESTALARGHSFTLLRGARPERVGGVMASVSCLEMLGARAGFGRMFLPSEERPGRSRVVILSHELWRNRFGGDQRVVGGAITIRGESYTVVGILEEGFSLTREEIPMLGDFERADYWVPLILDRQDWENHNNQNFNMLARLKPGVDLQRAQAEMDVMARRLTAEYPQVYPPAGGFQIEVVSLHEQVVGDVRPNLWGMLGSVGLIVLIACANVAALLLSRAAGRAREFAVRSALGARRSRIVRQLAAESLLLAVAGGAAGLFAAFWGLHPVLELGGAAVPRANAVRIDGTVALFACGLTLVTTLLFGLAPAWAASTVKAGRALERGDRRSTTASVWGRRAPTLKGLIAVQISLAFAVLIGAGLLARSFHTLLNIDLGFSPGNVLSLELQAYGSKYPRTPERIRFHERLRRRVAGLPGVLSAAAVSEVPLGPAIGWGGISVEGHIPGDGEERIGADKRVASVGYFRTMQIPLLAGRVFGERDSAGSPRVAMVDENFARRFWPRGDAVGKRIRHRTRGSSAPWITIVGVVGNVKQYGLDLDDRITMYEPQAQRGAGAMYLVARTTGDPAIAQSIISEVHKLDPEMPILRLATMAERVASSLARRRFFLLLMGAFAVCALMLAVVGVYGVVAYLVSQSTNEIGIRMALGAGRRSILVAVVGSGLRLAVAGVGFGALLALGGAKLLSSMLFGVGVADVSTYVVAALVLTGATAMASYIPARRAAGIEPMRALRFEP